MKGAHSKLAGVLADIKKNNRDEAPLKRRHATYVAQSRPTCTPKANPRTGTCRLRLFDRPVDLGPFYEDTSLYTITRAWIHGTSTVVEKQQTDSCGLPPPKPKVMIEVKTVTEEKIDQPMSHERYLDLNKIRWKSIRRDKMEARKIHEARYEESFRILQEMRDEALNPATN